jgi:hypothetical protein
MDREIFENWFHKQFVQAFLKKRKLPQKAVLPLDNAHSHPKEREY